MDANYDDNKLLGPGRGRSTLPRKMLKILCRNNAFWCKIFTWFYNAFSHIGGGAAASPLESATAVSFSLKVVGLLF